MKNKTDIVELFKDSKINDTYVKVCAPMVRYSKVQFRTLVKNFGVDLTFTPMILADSFCQHAKARASEFSTTINDTPLIVQFAANTVDEFLDASKLIHPYADGVDLNCGCPQRWAMKDGYGCALLTNPNLIHDLVRGVKNSLPNNFSISVKIRVLKELKNTIEMCRQLEKCGVTFLTVHGRTPTQKSGDSIDIEALSEVCKSVSVPVIANGGVKSLANADELFKKVKCSGVMAASGMLSNPALFSGANRTPLNCIKLWMDLKNMCCNNISYQCYHHHLVFMLDKILSRQEKQKFNYLSTFASVDEYLEKYVLNGIDRSPVNIDYNMTDFLSCDFPDEIIMKHSTKCRKCSRSICYCICAKYDHNTTQGSYFTTQVKENDGLDYMECNIFNDPI